MTTYSRSLLNKMRLPLATYPACQNSRQSPADPSWQIKYNGTEWHTFLGKRTSPRRSTTSW